MTLPILVAQTNGQFSATLVGSPDLRCVAPTRAEAIAALQIEVAQKVSKGELVNLEVSPLGVSDLAGRFKDDPELRDICKNIYAARDAEPLP
jgi:hypothetical protein